MIYLQKVAVRLAKNKYLTLWDLLAERLRREGILCDVREILPETSKEASAGSGVSCPEGTLWLTDSAAFGKKLWGSGCPLLIILEEEDRATDFSFCQYACEGPEDLEVTYLDRIYRRYLGLPWDILETERCLVRETTVADVDDFYRIYAEPSVTKFMDGLYGDPEEERAYAKEYIEKVYRFFQFGIWTVVEKSSGAVIGRAGICYREGYEDPEIGFVIGVPWQGRGYASEVCEAILSYAGEELGFPRVLAFVRPDNIVSLHLCEKLGMRRIGQVTVQGADHILLAVEKRTL